MWVSDALPDERVSRAGQAFGFALVTLALMGLAYLVTGAAGLLQWGTLLVGLLVGFGAYAAGTSAVLSTTLAAWFAAALLRRLVDASLGAYTALSPVVLLPLAVSAPAIVLGGWVLWRGGARVLVPYQMVALAVAYGAAIGGIRNGLVSATIGTLEWGGGLLLAAWLAERATHHPEEARRARYAFLVALVIAAAASGAYGVWQFVALPSWDRLWMEGAAMGSIGRPEPFLVRVFGPLNSPGPFAVALVAGLTALFGLQARVRWVGAPPMVLGLLLSLVRSAWGGLAIGLCVLSLRLRARQRATVLAGILVLTVGGWWLVGAVPQLERVQSRVQSITELEDDASYNDRVDLLAASRGVFANPIGGGVGQIGRAAKAATGQSAALDNGVVAVFAELGWLGAVLVFSGLWMLTKRASASRSVQGIVCLSISSTIIVQMIFVNTLTGMSGYLAWTALALAAIPEETEAAS